MSQEYEHTLADALRILMRFERKNGIGAMDYSHETNEALEWIEDNSEQVAALVLQALTTTPQSASTARTFTQEQANAMYLALQQIDDMLAPEVAVTGSREVVHAWELAKDTLQAIDTQPATATEPSAVSQLFHLIDILDLGDSQTGTECENCGLRYSQQILCPQCGKPYNWTLADYKQHAATFAWFADNVNHIRMIASPPATTSYKDARGVLAGLGDEPAEVSIRRLRDAERPMYGVRFTHGKWYVWHEWGDYAWLPHDSEQEATEHAAALNAGAQTGGE